MNHAVLNPERCRLSWVRTMVSAAALATSSMVACAQAPSAQTSGIESHYHDSTVRAQDNFFRNSQGLWLKQVDIPATRSDWGVFAEAREGVQKQLAVLVKAAAEETKPKSLEVQQIAALYRSYLNLADRDAQGLKGLHGLLARVDGMRSKADLAAVMAELARHQVSLPVAISVGQDKKNATQYLLGIHQSGLTLPDRDYYLNLAEAKNVEIQQAWQQHVLAMIKLAGWEQPEAMLKGILAIENQLAAAQWTKVANRDPHRTYNLMSEAELKALAPGLDWAQFFKANGVRHGDRINVAQPSYVQALGQVVAQQELAVWQSYLKWKLLNQFAPVLSQPMADEHFAFFGKTLSGTQAQKPLEGRAVEFVDQHLGEPLGKLYVARYFPADAKKRTEVMVGNFLKAFGQGIEQLDWMSPETKLQAQAKLKKISVKIGYPDVWRDYSKLVLRDQGLVQNVLALNRFAFERSVNKLGAPVDRSEWHMSPQTVNAYYSPTMNEIVFPAARLQHPLFNVNAEDAVNYGSLGISIGHEISHAFDDQGSKYDGDGNLRDWWTAEDKERFKSKTRMLVAQYGAYSPVPGYYLNGELTLGENIADVAGLVMALRAYRLSLNGKPAPVIDGWTAEQRLFMGVAQARRFKAREARAITLIKTDPHSPGEFRVNGSVRNHDEFYKAFDVKAGDQMYLAPDERVRIW